jgi:hypothetical protein
MRSHTVTDPNAPAGTADQYEQAQIAEWTTYVALVPIDFYGTRAYNKGDPVPVSAVDGDAGWVRPEFVAREGTPYEGSATVPPPEPPPIDESNLAAPPASSPDPGSIVTSSED